MGIVNRKTPSQIITICLLVSIVNLLPIIIATPIMLRSQLSGIARVAILANSIIHLAFLSWTLLMFYRGKTWAMYLLLATLASNTVYYIYLLIARTSYTNLHYGYIGGFAVLNLYALSLSLSKRSQSYFKSRSVVKITQFLCALTTTTGAMPSKLNAYVPPTPA